jgi:alkylresorcinol/alkylpyrone synthase
MNLSIKKIFTKPAGKLYSQTEASETVSSWLQEHPHLQQSAVKLCGNSGVKSRSFISSPSEIITLNSVEERCAMFVENGKKLLQEAIAAVLDTSSESGRLLDNLIFSSCTMPTIPAIDCEVIQTLGLKVKNRVPLFQYGCGGGAFGISLANRLKGTRSVVASVELCSLNFQPSDLTGASLVGSAIFADGAGAVLLEPDTTGWVIVANQSVLLPEGTEMMGYDLKDTGNHLRLSKLLPGYLTRLLPGAIGDFLKEQELTLKDIAWWLVHPGGIKILKNLEENFGITSQQMQFSYEVLQKYGNMSSATLLFVLNHFIDSKVYKDGDYALMLGIAPGMMAELILMQYRE